MEDYIPKYYPYITSDAQHDEALRNMLLEQQQQQRQQQLKKWRLRCKLGVTFVGLLIVAFAFYFVFELGAQSCDSGTFLKRENAALYLISDPTQKAHSAAVAAALSGQFSGTPNRLHFILDCGSVLVDNYVNRIVENVFLYNENHYPPISIWLRLMESGEHDFTYWSRSCVSIAWELKTLFPGVVVGVLGNTGQLTTLFATDDANRTRPFYSTYIFIDLNRKGLKFGLMLDPAYCMSLKLVPRSFIQRIDKIFCFEEEQPQLITD